MYFHIKILLGPYFPLGLRIYFYTTGCYIKIIKNIHCQIQLLQKKERETEIKRERERLFSMIYRIIYILLVKTAFTISVTDNITWHIYVEK